MCWSSCVICYLSYVVCHLSCAMHVLSLLQSVIICHVFCVLVVMTACSLYKCDELSLANEFVLFAGTVRLAAGDSYGSGRVEVLMSKNLN